jgi:2-polyprenyl-6-methoxyphenol hydroxylase-like FAD-dependent oxidoreductase
MTLVPDCDVAIVGAGLSGTIAAAVLARNGHRVVLIDRNADFPPEFRVEKVGGDQVSKLARLDLLPALAARASRFDEIVNVRRGRIIDHTRVPHYGAFYHEMVTAMRAALPASVRFVVGRVTGLATTDDVQTLDIADRPPISARLLVLASGMSDLLRGRLGIEREVLHERQSLTFGFDLAAAGSDGLLHRALTHYGETPADGIDYISIFPVGSTTRANLFTFLDHRDPWVKAMRTDPHGTLTRALPGLSRVLGEFEVLGKVQNWIMDLSVARNVVRPGVVLIGDAYQTSCPAAGTGVSRLLTDIEQLCRFHVPAWLATPGMSAEKIAGFYADPVKQAMDAHALALADFRRRFTIDTAIGWRTRRRAHFLRRDVMTGVERLSPSVAARLRSLKALART